MAIMYENNPIKKIYYEGSEVKKVFYENTQIYPVVSGPETGYWEARDFSTNFGNGNYYFVIYFAVLEKDRSNNRMRVKFEVGE